MDSLEPLVSTSPDFDVKDRVKQATDVVELIGAELNLRRKGAIFVGHCPWHDDTNPSFQVDPNKQSWVCYPCSIRGDVFDFVMKREAVDFRQALEILAERANIPLTKSKSRVVKGSPEDKRTLYRAMAWAEEEYHQCLLNSDAAIPVREYLTERGVTQESIKQFKIGFAPLSWTWLGDRARNTSFSPEVLEACDLLGANKHGGWYQRFRGRVLFPIRDTQERPIAIGGRIVPGLMQEGEDRQGKYVNTRETRLFSKSQNLYALNMARSYLQKAHVKNKSLTIVEGYTDVVAAWQAGLQNVVAALGVALNEQHIRLIKRFADSITLVLDGDEAGQRTMNNVLDLFVAHDIDLRILSLPEGLDPFDYLMENDGDAFQAMVDSAPDAIAHKILVETRGIDLVNETQRANMALENVLSTLARIPSSVVQASAAKSMRQDQIIMRLARQFQIGDQQVRRRLSELKMGLQSRLPSFGGNQERNDDYSKFNLNEKELVELLIQDPSLLDRAVENVAPTQFELGLLRELYEVMGECFHDGKDVGYEQLMLELEDPRLKSLVDYLYDSAITKKAAQEESNSGIGLDLEGQLESVIAAFNVRVEASGNRAKIIRLQQTKLDAKEETETLEQLFQEQLLKMKKEN